MQGTIVAYDKRSEQGQFQGEDGELYDFSLSICYGFEFAPAEEDIVEYGFDETGDLYFVEYAPFSDNKSNSSSDVSPVEVEEDDEIPQDIYEPIQLAKNVPESLDHYFSEIIIDVEDFEFEFREFESLDYLKMRRFLTTAYNNLLDLDSRFVNNDLNSLHEYVTELYKLYQVFIKRLSVPRVAYEEIFLNAQPDFVWRKERLELNKGEMITQKGVAKNLASQMDMIRKRMEVLSDVPEVLENEYKRCNRMYVDTLHRYGTLREENILLSSSIEEFENEHYGPFVTQFTQFARQYKEQILRLLDGYAYFFDKKMWECAEQSQSIREFFRRANVQDEFSSKTYLKYYLKGIDELKMSTAHRELKTLLGYLESLAQVSVVIVDENKETRSKLLRILRLAGEEVKVSALERVKVLHQRLYKESIDLVLIDKQQRNPNIIKSIETIYEIEKDREKKCRICVLGENFSKKELQEFNQLGIVYFIVKSAPEEKLSQYVDQLLTDLRSDQLGKE